MHLSTRVAKYADYLFASSLTNRKPPLLTRMFHWDSQLLEMFHCTILRYCDTVVLQSCATLILASFYGSSSPTAGP